MAGATDFRRRMRCGGRVGCDRVHCDRSGARGPACSFEPQGEGRVSRGHRCAQLSPGRRPRGAPRRHRAGRQPASARRMHCRRSSPAATSRCAARPTRRTATAGSRLSCSSIRPQSTRCRPCCWRRARRWSRPTSPTRSAPRNSAAAEAAARQARRGIWADPAAIKNAESPGDILAGIGRFTVVEGKVLSVRQAGATTYINFGRHWTRDFAVTISRRMMPAFEAAGITPKSLENRRIRVRGWIEARGGPRIEALRVGQIEMLARIRAGRDERQMTTVTDGVGDGAGLG